MNENSHQYAVILAGGKGERLWPLSRQSRPKQFLSVCNGVSLLEQTIDRVSRILPKERIFLLCAQDQEILIDAPIREKIGGVITEPVQRNTGPAIALGCYRIFDNDPEACITFLPADHVIQPQPLFEDALKRAWQFCSRSSFDILLFGIKPTRPATGYGYLECASEVPAGEPARVIKFHEKPELSVAQKYLLKPNFFWNSGLFCAQARSFIAQFKRYAPEIADGVEHFVRTGAGYEMAPAVSIDYAVLEKSSDIFGLPVEFQWSDVGNLDAFLSLAEQAGAGNAPLQIDAARNLVHAPSKTVVLIGVHDVCIVETSDALLVARREDVERVKQALAELKLRGLQKLL